MAWQNRPANLASKGPRKSGVKRASQIGRQKGLANLASKGHSVTRASQNWPGSLLVLNESPTV